MISSYSPYSNEGMRLKIAFPENGYFLKTSQTTLRTLPPSEKMMMRVLTLFSENEPTAISFERMVNRNQRWRN
jgi:hypothetical protein